MLKKREVRHTQLSSKRKRKSPGNGDPNQHRLEGCDLSGPEDLAEALGGQEAVEGQGREDSL